VWGSLGPIGIKKGDGVAVAQIEHNFNAAYFLRGAGEVVCATSVSVALGTKQA
jgi:hypothetical protein